MITHASENAESYMDHACHDNCSGFICRPLIIMTMFFVELAGHREQGFHKLCEGSQLGNDKHT